MHEFKQLDPASQAALLYAVVFDVKDQYTLFKIAKGQQRFDNLKEKSKIVSVNKWYKSPVILAAFADLKYILEDRLNKENEKYYNSRRETETGEGVEHKTAKEDINFLNLDEFLQFANRQANDLRDEKDKRAYLDMIAKLMNFKESEEETDQIRAYIPQTCDRCPLYQAAKDDKTL